MTDKINLPALRAFADALKTNPDLLFTPELSFLRSALEQYGDLKRPAPKAPASAHSHAHSHDHGHSHAHGSGCTHDHKPASSASSSSHSHQTEHVEEHVIEEEQEEPDDERILEETEEVLSIPVGGEDWDGAADAKEKANDAKANGNYAEAIVQFTKSLTLGQVSAITLANRAECLLKAKRPLAAISDCNAAIAINPDSAKALRCRGRAERYLGKWENSTKDLSAAQRIDFDPDVESMLKFVASKLAKLEARRAKQRNLEEEKQRERLLKRKAEVEEARRRAQEEEKHKKHDEDDDDFAGGIPGMGGAGGFPGMGGAGGAGMQQMIMNLLMSDPELAAGMQNPKIMAAFTSVMSGGGLNSPKMAEAMKDPEVKSFIDKVTTKLGPILGMMGGGAGGGFPGAAGGFPGAGGGFPGAAGGFPGAGGGFPGANPPGRNPGAPSFEEEVD